MDWTTACVAVVPCYNEAAALPRLLQQIREFLPRVIVIDDGSTDDTSRIAQTSGVEVIRHEKNLGKGAALASGWSRARELGFQWALCLDGDGQHAATDIPAFFHCAAETGASLVIGNRMGRTSDMPALRRFVNHWMSQRLSRLAGRELPDTQCGFRLVDLGVWPQLRLSATRFEVESDVLVAFVRAGKQVEFVPIEIIYKDEQSKIHPIRDTIRWFRWWREVNRSGR